MKLIKMVPPEATAKPDSGLTVCPSVQELSRLLEGTSADTEHIAAHVETCVACQLKLEELTGDADEVRLPKSHMPDYLSSLAPQLAQESAQAASELPAFTLPGFEVLECVGRGGMGAVYRARHQQLDREVAVKVIAAGAHAGPAYRERLDREGRLVAKLDHPHIVRIFDSGQHDSLPYLVLEFMDGGSLAERRDQLRDPREIARLLELLARAVHAAHEVGIVHRDLKPGNVLLARTATNDSTICIGGESFVPRIADFGLSKQMLQQQDLSHSAGMLGTPGYMAPEQATESGSEIGTATDVHALGIILYELLAGQRPFDGGNTLGTIDLIRSQHAPDLVARRKDVPSALADICHQCLQKRTADRYESALQLAEELSRFSAGERLLHTRTRRSVPGQEFGRTVGQFLRGKPALWIAVMTAAVLLFSVFRIQTNRGTVVIDADESLEIEIRRNDETVETLTVTGDAESRRLFAGDIEIVIPAELKDQFTVTNSTFHLNRDGHEVVTIRHIAPGDARETVGQTGVGQKAPQPGVSQREFATWFLDNGGIVRLDGRPEFNDSADLPDGPIEIHYLLDARGFLRAEHLPLIASLPHLQHVQIFCADIGEQIAALNDMPDLQSLSLNGCPINDRQWSNFTNYSNLTTLATAGTQISTSFIDRLAAAPGLQTLDVSEQQFLHPEGVEFVRGAESLRTLGIYHFTDASAGVIAELPQLNEIRCQDSRGITQETIDAIASVSSLTRLKFWRCDLSGIDLTPLQRLPDLVWVELKSVNLTADEVADVAAMLPNADMMFSVEKDIASQVAESGGTLVTRQGSRRKTKHPTYFFELIIDEISFVNSPHLRDEHFLPYQHLQHLKSLTVNHAGIDGSTLKHLSHLTTLEHLSLANTRISDRSIGFLPHLTGLKSVDLRNTKVTARGLMSITELTHLESLSLDGQQITDSAISLLGRLSQLRHLRLGRASNMTVAQIAALQQLEHLTIDESYTVTEACLSSLATLQKLESLTLGSTNIPEAAIEELKTRLPKCRVTIRR